MYIVNTVPTLIIHAVNVVNLAAANPMTKDYFFWKRIHFTEVMHACVG